MAEKPEQEWIQGLEAQMKQIATGVNKLIGDSTSQNRALSDGVQTIIDENTSFGKNINVLTDKIDSSGGHTQNTGLRPPMFSGLQKENANQWLGKFNTFCTFSNWKNEKCRDAFRLLLTGPAELWFGSLTVAERGKWETVQTKFIERFTAQNTWVLEQELADRKQQRSEPVEDYIVDIQRRCQQLCKSTTEQLSIFVRNLQPEIRAYVVGRNPKNLTEAEEFASLGESVLTIQKQATEADFTPSRQQTEFSIVANHLQNQMTEIKRQGEAIASLKGQVNIVSQPDQPGPDRYQEPRAMQGNNWGRPRVNTNWRPQQPNGNRDVTRPLRETRVCFKCGKQGHIARDCRQSSPVSYNVTCYKCGRMGHLANRCQMSNPGRFGGNTGRGRLN